MFSDRSKETKDKINSILLQIRKDVFARDDTTSRDDYAKKHGKEGLWHFSLSAEDIIKNKITSTAVVGCTGCAKVFAKLATDAGLEVFVLTTAEFDSWEQARKGGKNIINGHQIIAVMTEKGLRAFDPSPAYYPVTFIPIDTEIKIGNFINAINGKKPYLITSIVPAKYFQGVDSYQKLQNLYASGNISDSGFKVEPNIASRESCCKQMQNIR